jgi:5,10-methylenetetrahydromethanopterin reductase
VWLFPDDDARTLVEAVVAAESLGLDELWFGDEGPGARDPFTILAASALQTSRLTLGIAVTNPYLRHPATIAATAMTLQELTNGRTILGLGAGGDLSLSPVHVQRDAPLRRIESALRTIRSVTLAQSSPEYSPDSTAFKCPVPLYVGARGELINRSASSKADGAFLGGIPFSQLALALSWVHSFRVIDVALYVNAVFEEEQLEEIRPRLLHPFLDAPPSTQRSAGLDPLELANAARSLSEGDSAPARRLMTNERLGDLVLVGRPAKVGRRLADLARRFGPRHLGLSFLTATRDHHLSEAAEAFSVVRKELD